MSLTLPTDSVELHAFYRLFDAQVSRTPEREAIFFENETWTYQQLSDFSQRIALELHRRGVSNEECVGICVDRSPGAIAAMLGIMRAGGAFVPLDPELPSDRIQFMIDDAGINQLICDQKYADLCAGLGVKQWVTLETLRAKECVSSSFVSAELPEINPDQLAYVMYTSGSTGKPKGVMIECGALTAYCLADIDVYKVTESDRTLHFSTINFDIAIEEIFPPLLTGGAVVVRPRQRTDSHNELSTLIRNYNVTAVHLATAYWHEWVDLMVANHEAVPETLRLLIATGEKVSVEHYRRWKSICRHDVQWSNAYGPTEATVSSTVFTPSSEWNGEAMPIGKPLKRYDAYILDSEGRECGVGELGELVVGGPGLARGYLRRPELTERAFVQWNNSRGDSKRIYRTGDLARWDSDGNIEFAGRIDHQIKVGSYRIEPGEIEAIMNQHSAVLESLVVHELIENQKYLIAFVATSSTSLDVREFARFLRDRLPPYMVPTRYVLVDRFPKTLNGKIDRKALPPVENAVTLSASDTSQNLDETEKLVAQIWSDVLQISGIGCDDNFFFLGGSSLLVTRVVSKIKQVLGIELPVRDVFANPVLQDLASHLKTMCGYSPELAIPRSKRTTRLPKIESQFIPSANEKIFTVHYAGRGAVKDHSVLICGSVGHEYARSHRNLQQLAQLLAEQGFHVLRMDYSNTGNSTGNCDGGKPQQWCADIANAAAWLRNKNQTENLSVIGMRLGATLLSNTEGLQGNQLIYWDPVMSGERFLSQLAQFHRRALRDFVRYSYQRLAEPHQFYGFVTNERAIIDLCKMKLQKPKAGAFLEATLLTSRGYWVEEKSEESFSDLAHHFKHREVDDEIMWHLPQYTESAFASAHVYRAILSQLTDGGK